MVTRLLGRGKGLKQVDWSAPSSRGPAYAATAVGVLAAGALKAPCVIHPWADFFAFRRLCYNDIQPLWGLRGIAAGLLPYRDVQFEYPVLTGMFMDLAGRLLRILSVLGLAGRPSDRGYFLVSAALMAPCAFVVTGCLRPRVSAARLLIWAVGTPIILYGFMSWDLLAVAPATWATAAFLGKRYGRTGVALAVGASAKLYPVFIMPALLLALWAASRRKAAARMLASLFLVYGAINVPWILISQGPVRAAPSVAAEGVPLRAADSNGWLGVWKFHAGRAAEYDTVWFWVAEHGKQVLPNLDWGPGYQAIVSVGSLALFGGTAVWLLWTGWRRTAKGGPYPWARVGLGILCVFLLVSKIYSPQYGLWIAPLLCLVAVPWSQVAGFMAADLVVFVSRFQFYIDGANTSSPWAAAFEAGVWLRAGVLAAMVWWAARSQDDPPIETDPVSVPSHRNEKVSRPGKFFRDPLRFVGGASYSCCNGRFRKLRGTMLRPASTLPPLGAFGMRWGHPGSSGNRCPKEPS